MILAGDIGATKVFLEAGALRQKQWRPVRSGHYLAADYPDFESVLSAFFSEWAARRKGQVNITRACLGVAGPEFDNRVRMINSPWIVDAERISRRFGIGRVRVINDFAAAASGIDLLKEAELVTLQTGEPDAAAPCVVIGAGTGLGVAYRIRAGARSKVIAGEAGHAGFAPAAAEQCELWHELYSRQGHVAAEDVVSGPGLVRVHDFLRRRDGGQPTAASATAEAIVRAALDSGDELCSRALDLFVSCFAAVAGDLALSVMARGGVYLAGGVAPKILPRLVAGGFRAAFNAKGLHSSILEKIPIRVVTNEKLGVLGAAVLASRL